MFVIHYRTKLLSNKSILYQRNNEADEVLNSLGVKNEDQNNIPVEF